VSYVLDTSHGPACKQMAGAAIRCHHQGYTFRVRPNDVVGAEYGSILISSWQIGSSGFTNVSEATADER